MLKTDLKQSMWTQALLLNSSSESRAKPISLYIEMPWMFARASTKGKSKASPLKVAITVGLTSRMCSNQRRMRDGWGRAGQGPSCKQEVEEGTDLVRLVEDGEGALVFRLGRIFEVVDVLADDVAVCDEEALAVDHVRDHHDLVRLLVGELERRLGRLDVERHNHGLGTLDALGDLGDGDDALERVDRVPEPDSDVWRRSRASAGSVCAVTESFSPHTSIDGHPEIVVDVVLADVVDALARVEVPPLALASVGPGPARPVSGEAVVDLDAHGGLNDLGVGVDRVELGLVGGRERDDLASDREEVGRVVERELQEGRAVAHEMVWLREVQSE